MKEKDRKARFKNLVPTYYSPADVAAILNVSLRTVRGWINEGKLPSIRFGGKNGRIIRISHQDLEAFLDQYRQAPGKGGDT
jgi:excisionase family DNA binding protein